jgi:hypothetical protein
MGFSDSFSQCMSPLPTPGEILDSAGEVVELLHKLHQAWEAAGGDEDMTIAALVAAGAATGIDEAALAVLGEIAADAAAVTVAAYTVACVGCLVGAAGSSIWQLVASNDTPSWLQGQLQAEAEQQGVTNPSANA